MTCKLVPAVLIGYGIVLSFLYFSRALNFFPSGLNVGDTLLLVFITLGYTLFFWAIAGSGMGGCIVLSNEDWASLGRPKCLLQILSELLRG